MIVLSANCEAFGKAFFVVGFLFVCLFVGVLSVWGKISSIPQLFQTLFVAKDNSDLLIFLALPLDAGIEGMYHHPQFIKLMY